MNLSSIRVLIRTSIQLIKNVSWLKTSQWRWPMRSNTWFSWMYFDESNVSSKLRSYVWIGLKKEGIRRMKHGKMFEMFCLACIRGKGMERVEYTFYNSWIWVNVEEFLKERYNTCFQRAMRTSVWILNQGT